MHGPLNSDHWYTYVADDGKRPDSAVADRTLNLMMYDLEPDIATNFYKSDEVRARAVFLGCWSFGISEIPQRLMGFLKCYS